MLRKFQSLLFAKQPQEVIIIIFQSLGEVIIPIIVNLLLRRAQKLSCCQIKFTFEFYKFEQIKQKPTLNLLILLLNTRDEKPLDHFNLSKKPAAKLFPTTYIPQREE